MLQSQKLKCYALVSEKPRTPIPNAGHKREISAVLGCHFSQGMRGFRQYKTQLSAIGTNSEA